MKCIANSLADKPVIEAGTNQRISSSAPSKYLSGVESSAK